MIIMLIRMEENKDYEAVYDLIVKAFANVEHRDGREQDLVVALRKSESFISELSLVAEKDGRVVGHILFTKIKIGGKTELALAPLSVLPEYQKQGIGQALIRSGHEIAAKMGYEYSVVLGHEKYYPKVGYVPAEQYGIKAPFEVPSENFMAFDLQGNSDKLKGVVEYAKEFFEA